MSYVLSMFKSKLQRLGLEYCHYSYCRITPQIMLVVELVHKGDLKECLTFMRPK